MILLLGRPTKNGDTGLKSPISPSPVFVPINGFKTPDTEDPSLNQTSLPTEAAPKVCTLLHSFVTRLKMITCSRWLKTGCNNVVLPTLFIVVTNIVQHC